jgi:hypothetical protein
LNNGSEILGDDDIIKHATECYKGLFGQAPITNLRLEEIEGSPITEEDRANLTKGFDLEEIRDVVFDLKHNKAAGELYQTFWEVIKYDLKEVFDAFHQGRLDIERLNHGVISLIPKVPNADIIQKFRPICVILTKILANRLGLVIHKIISHTQTAFIKDRHIIEGIFIIHETIHEIHHKKLPEVLFKIDFEKAYDKVNWAFLYQMMQLKGLGAVMCDWLMEVVRGGRVEIKVNDQDGSCERWKSGNQG